MTERRPSQSSGDEDSDFLWQSTCGSDISPCLAEPGEESRHPRDSDRSHSARDSLDISESQQLDSFDLDSVDLPSSTNEAHAIVGRRARWRGAEIYSGPASSPEPIAEAAAPSSLIAAPAPAIPPMIPLVATMAAAALAFVLMVALPGQFGGPNVGPANFDPEAKPAGPVGLEVAENPAAPPMPAIPPEENQDKPISPDPGATEVALPKNQGLASDPPPADQRPAPATPSPLPARAETSPPIIPPQVGPALAAPRPPLPVPPEATPAPPVKPQPEAKPAPALPPSLEGYSGARAETLLSMARQVEAAGNVKAAIGRYQRLVEQFPNTAVGREAEARLAALKDATK